MDMRQALKEQYHAGLAMLTECVEKCPEELWLTGEPPRTVWRIAFHTVFFTHLYLVQGEAAFTPWPGQKDGIHPSLGRPHQPAETELYRRDEILDYLRYLDERVDGLVDTLDLDAAETGFSWYPDMSKLSHQLLNLRHLQGHVGQLSEQLMARGIDTDWVGLKR